MAGFVIAISGGIGAGKTALAEKLAEALHADRVSFGREVRRYAEENGENPKDRSVLQQLGQALVLTQCNQFVERVLAQRPQPRSEHLIVEGVRHVEVLMELKRQLDSKSVHLVHVVTPGSTREQRVMERDDVERRLVARYDNDITEAQVSRILPQYASLTVNGELPIVLQVAQVMQKAAEWSATGSERPEAA
ncbi:AAA family ATPase [Methylobacterium sp. NEAU K]|uniref:AAA family ATPase n=1 Tax=Methylobacterium sp. NEAU K TaxID=3064946 RepID=UPI0027349344|nr:AAA family ATPase [Methylobacterium sp. NEAU K]MDP4006393.1 AAA family ATPase [Methylobacterium sp. NEAU K]